MKAVFGPMLVATAVLHQVVGVVAGWPVVVQIATLGVPSEPTPETAMRSALFWFFAFGFLLLAQGLAVWAEERAQRAPGAVLGWALVAIGLAGGLMMPASGFWLVVPQGAAIVWRAKR